LLPWSVEDFGFDGWEGLGEEGEGEEEEGDGGEEGPGDVPEKGWGGGRR
jgi:hypothetical protein